ncbi:glutathione s-transferase zeta class, partial [Quercus suber]
ASVSGDNKKESELKLKLKLKLYSYWKSSCSFRVRIALNLKEFTKLNPIGYVPVIVDGDLVLSYSFAILLTQFPVLSRLNEAYNEIPAFQDAMPEKQPDTPLTSAS